MSSSGYLCIYYIHLYQSFRSQVLCLIRSNEIQGIWDFCELLDLKESRTKVILQRLSDYIEMVGSNRDRRYKKK